MLPILASQFDITVHEFEGADNSILDLAANSSIKKVTYPALQIRKSILQKLPVIGFIYTNKILAKSYSRMAEEINKEKPDCVLISHCRYTQSPILMRMINQPLVYFCHEPPRSLYEPLIDRPYIMRTSKFITFLRTLNGKLRRRMDLNIVKKSKALIANSCYSAEVLYRIYGKKATPAQLAVDTKVFYHRNVTRENFILSVGSLNPIKAHDFAIRCVSMVKEKERPVLIIASPIGTQLNPERIFLSELAKQSNVALEFQAISNDDDLATLYSRAAVTIYCPHLEPFGLVSLESMACGTPVLGVAEGGLRETIIHNKTGFLLPWVPEIFAKHIEIIISDRNLLETMGEAGVKWAMTQWTWQRCAETVSEVVEKTISENGG